MTDISPSELGLIVGAVVLTAAWFWSLIDCAVREHERDMDKLVWVAIIISTYIFGSLAYLWVWRRRTRPRPRGVERS